MTSAFFIRLENFKSSQSRSIDEIVYYRLGLQVKDDFFNYNTIPYGQELAARGRPLPDYFFKPLYKYPPLFAWMIAQSLKLFGDSLLSAYYPSLLCGVGLILLIYWLGAIVYNRMIGFIAALFLYIDPVTIVCSQKVWLDTPLAFFSLISIIFFVWGLKSKRSSFFIASGIGCGLAVWIKYPGILLIPIYIIYALIYEHNLLKKRKFWAGILIPLIMLIPWSMWSKEVYGSSLIDIGIHLSDVHRAGIITKIIAALGAALILMSIYLLNKYKLKKVISLDQRSYNNKKRLNYVCAIAFFIILSPYLINSLNLNYLPTVGWRLGMFLSEPPIFYFGRLIEFSLMYAIAFSAFFIRNHSDYGGPRMIKMTCIFLMVFYSFWGNYQSRYILVCIPLLLILAAQLLTIVNSWAFKPPSLFKRILRSMAITICIFYIIFKTHYINVVISYPNDLCYF